MQVVLKHTQRYSTREHSDLGPAQVPDRYRSTSTGPKFRSRQPALTSSARDGRLRPGTGNALYKRAV